MKTKKKPAAEPTGVLGITTGQPLQPDSFKSLLVPLQHKSLVKLHTQGGIEQGADRTATRIFFKLGKLLSMLSRQNSNKSTTKSWRKSAEIYPCKIQ